MRAALFVVVILGQSASAGFGAQTPDRPRDQYETLIRDWDEYSRQAEKEWEEATSDEAKRRFSEKNQEVTHAIGKRALELARSHLKDSAAVDSLLWVVHLGYRPETAEAWKLLTTAHIDSDRLAPACRDTRRDVAGDPALAEKFLRAAIEKSPHREVQGQARFALAIFLNFRAEAFRSWSEADRARFEKLLKTPEDLAMYRDRSAADLAGEAKGLYEQVVADYADLKDLRGRLLGERAKGELNELQSLKVGDTAPEVEGEDAGGVRFKLSDYRGKVVVLTFSGNWCGPCRAMYPEERELVEAMNGKPFALLSVNTDDARATLEKSIAAGEVTWRCWWDGAPGGPICTAWGIEAFPMLYLIDQKGVIRSKGLGDGQTLRSAVEALLAGEPGK